MVVWVRGVGGGGEEVIGGGGGVCGGLGGEGGVGGGGGGCGGVKGVWGEGLVWNQPTIFTREVRSWMKSVRRLCRVWSSLTYLKENELSGSSPGVCIVSRRRSVSTHHSLLQTLQVLLGLLPLLSQQTDKERPTGFMHTSLCY